MGTWISHLRIAEKLLAEIPTLDAAMFACGNLSPDSGLPNEDWTQFDPPKEVTHFLDKGQDEGKIKDLVFYREYLLNPPPEPEKYAFLLGYFFHLISDNLWSIRIGEITKKAFTTLFEEHGSEAWWTIKKDWYGLDFKYLRDNPNSLFWIVFLNAATPSDYLPYLPENALAHQLNYIRQFYSTPKPALDRDYLYLNETTMKRYVDESAALLLQIYHLLQKGVALNGKHTALQLLPDFEFVSYKMPIGDLESDHYPILMCPYDPNS